MYNLAINIICSLYILKTFDKISLVPKKIQIADEKLISQIKSCEQNNAIFFLFNFFFVLESI